jgi:hypothetical protein
MTFDFGRGVACQQMKCACEEEDLQLALNFNDDYLSLESTLVEVANRILRSAVGPLFCSSPPDMSWSEAYHSSEPKPQQLAVPERQPTYSATACSSDR